MAEELPGLQSKVTIDTSGGEKSLEAMTHKIEGFSRSADRSFNAFSKRVSDAFDKISGARATERLQVLEKALEKAGGAAKLTAPQLANLRKEIDAPAAAGGKVPSSLAGISQQASKLGQVGQQLLSGGGISTALSSLGPAGIAAAAGVTAALGAVAVFAKAVGDALGSLIDKTGQLSDLSQKTNIATDSLQKLGHAGELVGVSLDQISGAASIMARTLVDAPEKFEALGLSAQELRQHKPEEQFAQIAQAIAGIEDPTRQAHAAMQIFGKGGAELLPLLKSDIAAAAAEAEKLGFVLSADVVAAGDKLGDELTTLSRTWEGLKAQLVSVIATNPSLVGGLKDTAEVIGSVAKAINDNRATFEFLFENSMVGKFLEIAAGAARQANETKKSLDALFGEDPEIFRELKVKFGKEDPNLVAPSLGADQARLLKAGTKEVGATVEQMEAELQKLADQRKKALEQAAADAKKASETAAEAARKAAQELEQMVGPSAAKAQEQMDKLAQAVEETGGAFDRTKASYDTIIGNLERLEKQGAKVAPILKQVQEASIPKLPAQRDLGSIGEFVPGAAGPPAATGDVTALLQERIQAGLSTVTFLQREFGFTEQAARELEAQVLKTMGAASEGAVETTKATFDWGQALEDVSNLFNILGISADSTLGRILGGFTGARAAVGSMKDAIGKAKEGFAAGGGSILKGMKGFLTGGGIEGIVAAVGVVKQIAGFLTKSEDEKVMEGVGRQFGVKISEGLAKQIAEDSKALGDRNAAMLKNLSSIIGEAGGVKSFGVEKAVASTRDLFSALERGQLSVAEVGESFDKTFALIAPEAIDKTTGRASEGFKELIGLAKRFGIESAAMTDFLGKQAEAAGKNLGTAIKAGVATEAGAAGFGAALAAQLEEMVSQGATRGQAIAALQPAIQALREELERTGFAGGAAFDVIAAQAAIVTNEVTGPLVGKIEAIGSSLVALENQGLLTADIFTGLTTEVGATAEALRAQGVEAPAALAVMQPALQQIFELQQQYGFAVDETTQKLLDEAQAAGVVGEAHMSAQDRMVDAAERTADAVERLAQAFAGDLPDAAERGAQRVQDALAGIHPPDINIPVRFDRGQFPGMGDLSSVAGFARGGFQDFGRSQLAVLHGREAILPTSGGPMVGELARHIVAEGGVGAGAAVGDEPEASGGFAPIVVKIGERTLVDVMAELIRDNRHGAKSRIRGE